MYKKSIKEISRCLIPFVEGLKYYGFDDIEHNIGTMIILNKNGDVLTCKHIAEHFLLNSNLKEVYPKLMKELRNSNNIVDIENKYGLNKNSIVLSKIEFPYANKSEFNIDIVFHKCLDLALLRFKDIKFEVDNYPIFSRDIPDPGQSVCKLGFAFPEYDCFIYSKDLDDIILKKDIVSNFPLFPMDGIVSRHIVDENGNITMFETTSPGLRGQSGGPIFSPDGLIYGIQSMTKHIDLNFDINQYVKRGMDDKLINYTPFINLGVGITSLEVIKFLEDNKIEFNSM